MVLHHRPMPDFTVGYTAITDDGVLILSGSLQSAEREALADVYAAVVLNANLNVQRYNRRHETQFMLNTARTGFITIITPRYTVTVTSALTNVQFNALLDVYFQQR